MRLDKWLKVSRILKRRSVANDACGSGKVDVNGRPVKPAHALKEGDIISLTMGGVKQNFKVLIIKENVRKEDADKMYSLIK